MDVIRARFGVLKSFNKKLSQYFNLIDFSEIKNKFSLGKKDN